jgi:hypothetical protein
MQHAATQVIRDEHPALAATPFRCLLVHEGRVDGPERFCDVLRAMLF